MSSSRIKRRTEARAFTLVELMVAVAVFTVVGVAVMSLLLTTLQLSSANLVTNMSNYRARQTLDRVGELIRYAQDTPTLINANGTSTGTPSDGVLVKTPLGGPYVFKNSNGQTDDIPSGATSFMVEYAPAANVAAPEVGDYFLLNLSTRPELEVLTVTPDTPAGTISRVRITVRTGIAEIAQPNKYTVSAVRYRKEAYVFAADATATQWSLQHYSSVIPTTSYADATAYGVLGTGFQKLANQAWFTTIVSSGTKAFVLNAVARSSDHAEYAEQVRGKNTLTTMPVQSRLWNYNAPPP